MRPATTLALLCLAASAARADMGFSPVILDRPAWLVLKPAGDYTGYRFWLVPMRPELPVETFLGSADRITTNRLSPEQTRDFYLFAAPVKALEDSGLGSDWRPTWAMGEGKRPPWLTKSTRDRIAGGVWFYDSRDELTRTYRLELQPGAYVQLGYLGQEPEPIPGRIARYVIGLALFAAFAGVGVWVIRRIRRRRK